jgi:flavin-dependent dehydrogenase
VDTSIRRIEFDAWLLERAAAPFQVHRVNRITHENGLYILDGSYACRYLVGAGGNGCPVRRQLFPGERNLRHQILALEQEFPYPRRDPIARFFFFARGLMGYSWYVPKGNGFVNIGLGGFADSFGSRRPSIHEHFDWFVADLCRRNLLDASTGRFLRPSGYAYSMASEGGLLRQHNCLLIGDSAAMATIDFAEGIGPAIRSGLLAARELLGEGAYTRHAISPFSIRAGLRWMRPALLGLLALTGARQAQDEERADSHQRGFMK